MKNVKISLLAAGATLALLACSSLEVDNPTEENFPKDWSAAEYIKVNPDLRALQIRDQVTYLNTISGAENDDDTFLSDEDVVKALAVKHAGFNEADFDLTAKDQLNFIKAFNIYGVENEIAVFDTLTLDTLAIEKQYIMYGAIEGRPYRSCAANETGLVQRGECQADENPAVGYIGHKYCGSEGVVYCIDCEASLDCPDVVEEPESSSSATKPASSETAGDESSSSEGEGGEAADSSSSEGGEVAADSSSSEGGEPAADSSSSEETTAESSSSAE